MRIFIFLLFVFVMGSVCGLKININNVIEILVEVVLVVNEDDLLLCFFVYFSIDISCVVCD